jgi:D-alanyl-D-alanine carboxypeptidase
MENVKLEKKENVLTVTIDLSKTGTPSASGKTMVIASTKGNVRIEAGKDIFIGVNVYRTR